MKDRGCLTEENLCDDDPTCYSCTDSNNCNDQVPLVCHSCTFTSAEHDCLEDPQQSCKTITGCVALINGMSSLIIKLSVKEPTSRTISDNNSIVRDCAENLPKCRDGSCELRLTNAQDVCIDTSGGSETSLKVCSSIESKCWRYQKDGEVRMGCDEDTAEICNGDDGHCRSCNSILCNKEG